MSLISGKELAASIRSATAARVADLIAVGRPPRLAVVTATDDEATAWYVRSIAKSAGKAGIECDVLDLGPRATEDEITSTLIAQSADPAVHGVILQTPLPPNAYLAALAGAIDPAKDIDGVNPVSLGRLVAELPAFAPATAVAVVALLEHHGVQLIGRRAVVVGRSVVVGQPTAQLLLAKDATVTICHLHTRDLGTITRQAEVLVVATGHPHLIGPDDVSPGTTVIDVGTNATPDGGLTGDVAPEVAGIEGVALTPVPGGVGPVTTAVLLSHVVAAAAGAPRDSHERF